MRRFKSLHLAMLTLGSLCLNSAYASDTLHSLSDSEMSATTGQALMSLSYISPKDTANIEAARVGGDNNTGFYRLGLEAELELNANIKKLQLGCGGVNGAGGCDIDIDNVSLSGISDTNTGRASSSAKLTNPFIEFAIKNPDQASSREVVGLRLSAERIIGLLTLGTENTDSPNGLNSFSGYMKVQSGIGATVAEQSKVKGYADTAAQFMSLATYPINGNLVAIGLANASFVTNGGGFNIPAMNNLPFETEQMVVVGTRQKSVSLSASVSIPTINLGTGASYPAAGTTTSDANGTTTAVYTAGSPVDAKITGCTNTVIIIPACVAAPTGRQFTNIRMIGSVGGAKATVNFTESFGFIHRLVINSPASLSLQKQSILWPGSEALNVAQTGWWLALQDPISIGRVEPTNKLSIQPLLGQFATKAGAYLQANPAETNDLGGIISGDGLDANLGVIDFSDVSPLTMNLSDLRLNGQDFAPNCYGTLKFC